jgi:cytochrome c oxidase cbb3-type subunit 3
MKPLRLICLSLLVLGVQPAFAADSLLQPETMNYIGYGAILVAMVVILIAALMVLRAFKVLTRLVLGPEAVTNAKTERAARKAEQKIARADRLNKLLSLKPMSEEHTLILQDEYDGIRELNNPTPAWFMYLFYGTIIFAASYLLIYHVFKAAPLQYDEYKNEMALAAKEKATLLAKSANNVDENTVKLTTDPAVLSAGQTVFSTRCAACHGDKGQGLVGPNLTDDYWLHGNKISDVFKTIEYGVQSKGMPTWENQLTPKQISDVANYIKSLHGTHPANPKDPQGTKMTEDNSAPKPAEKTSKTAMLSK